MGSKSLFNTALLFVALCAVFAAVLSLYTLIIVNDLQRQQAEAIENTKQLIGALGAGIDSASIAEHVWMIDTVGSKEYWTHKYADSFPCRLTRFAIASHAEPESIVVAHPDGRPYTAREFRRWQGFQHGLKRAAGAK